MQNNPKDVKNVHKIKELFPDGKETALIFRISSQVYNSTNNRKRSWFKRLLQFLRNSDFVQIMAVGTK